MLKLREGLPRVPAHMAAAIPPDGPTAPLTGVLLKLLGFSVAMVVLPLGSYYASLKWVWGEKNYTPAGITAATMANLILVAFVVMAIREDQVEQKSSKSTGVKKVEGKKDQ